MKTTRRRLLAYIGLGAAAAALAPSVTPAQAVETMQCHQCLPDSLFPHVYGHPNDAAPYGYMADPLTGETWPAHRPDLKQVTFSPLVVDEWFQGEGQAYNSSWWPGGYTREPGYALPAGWDDGWDDRAAKKTLIADAEG